MAVMEKLFETALKLESPWKITKVDLNTEQGKITSLRSIGSGLTIDI